MIARINYEFVIKMQSFEDINVILPIGHNFKDEHYIELKLTF